MTDMLSTLISAKRAAGRVAPGLLLCAAATAAALTRPRGTSTPFSITVYAPS